MPTMAADIGELLATTLANFGPLKWSLISNTLQTYTAYGRFLKKGRVEVAHGGTKVEWRLQVADTGMATRSSLYDTDQLATKDTIKTASNPWVHLKVPYSMDVRQVSMNSGAAKIIDDWQAQRVAAMMSLASLLEQDFWNAPDANDSLKPRGLRYFNTKIGATSTPGFTGTHATGFSDCADLSSTTYTQWRNWNGTYTTVAQTDLIRKVKQAQRKCQFMPPVEHPNAVPANPNWEQYTNDTVYGKLGELAEAQNQNIGADLAAYEGRVTIGRVPVKWIPFLDADTADPFYGQDWSTFIPVVLAGEYLRESVDSAASNHNIKANWVDMTYGYKCLDRRRSFVLSTS